MALGTRCAAFDLVSLLFSISFKKDLETICIYVGKVPYTFTSMCISFPRAMLTLLPLSQWSKWALVSIESLTMGHQVIARSVHHELRSLTPTRSCLWADAMLNLHRWKQSI